MHDQPLPDQPPEHTCGQLVGNPKRDCPGCEYGVARFAQLWPVALNSVVADADGDGSPSPAQQQTFDDTFMELLRLGLLPPVWYTCAAAITQLADQPSAVDRDLWANIMALGLEPNLPRALDLIDELLTAVALDDREKAVDLLLHLAMLPVQAQAAVQLTLCTMAHQSMHAHLTLWQLVLHVGLLGDVWGAIDRPQAVLMAARITGARVAGDRDQARGLIRRAARQELLGSVVQVWAMACAARLVDPDMFALVRTDAEGRVDYLLNTRAPLDAASDIREQGYLLATRAIRALRDRDAAAHAEIFDLLADHPDRSSAMVTAMLDWHAEICEAVWGEYVRTKQEGVSS